MLCPDFISEPGWEKPLSRLSQGHEFVGIRLWDPSEAELPNAGLIVVEDAETGAQLYVDTSNAEFRRRFQAVAEQRENALKDTLKRAGVDLFSLSTTEDLLRGLISMVAQRKKRRR